ncbi:glycosyltransferase family 4 protein [Rhizobiales bacterium]|uniref:glycosyltransferase family 4 protein n=1 Tax=Hongsoonwoonella zoysiae TaxID=2821844 RepID=UPI0015603A14|nr:glycosyltransferase family 4 protein [Hongsoonwoonella zoysiae]NRG19357.1 glycosyltransferase family 4 protein [Hongsoonwoonella zoysiae]
MKVAIATPMKSIDDPVPSGERTMARLIVKALRAGGHDVEVATGFRAWRREGGAEIQKALEREALAEAGRIAERWETEIAAPDIFLTYHLYHKAPDWIGPALADRFSIPYAVVEASRAPKRRAGDWAYGFAAADAALSRADAVAALHRADAECLGAVVSEDRLSILPPFLDAEPFRAAARNPEADGTPPRLLAVGMMREGDKESSYRVLAEALEKIADLDWTISLVGGGPARERILSWFPPERTIHRGAVEACEMPAIYASHDVLVWPAIREAFGFVFLEAQAGGLAVVGGATFGVPDIVRDGVTGLLSPEGDAEALARNLRRILTKPGLRERLGKAASRYISADHDLAAGTARLNSLLERALRNFARRIGHKS